MGVVGVEIGVVDLVVVVVVGRREGIAYVPMPHEGTLLTGNHPCRLAVDTF